MVGILGGGNTVVDMAELSDIAASIHLIVRSKLKADKVLIDRLKTKKNIVLHKGYTIEEFGGGQFLEYVIVKKQGVITTLLGKGEEKILVDGVFFGIGLNPNTFIPAAIIMGGGFLLLVDDVSRTIATTEVPIGILTAFIGAPIFAYLLMMGGKRS